MDLTWLPSTITAVAGALATVVTVISTNSKNKKASQKEFQELKADVKSLKTDMRDTQISILQVKLLEMMNDYPTQVSGILEQAKKYFIDYEGDGFVFDEFIN